MRVDHRRLAHADWLRRRNASVARHKAQRRLSPRIGADPFAAARKRALHDVRKAQNRLPQQVRVPAIPLKPRYSKAEQRTVDALFRRAAKGSGKTYEAFKRDADKQTRLRIKAAERSGRQEQQRYAARSYRQRVAAGAAGATEGQILAGAHALTPAERRRLRQAEPQLRRLRHGRGLTIKQQAQRQAAHDRAQPHPQLRPVKRRPKNARLNTAVLPGATIPVASIPFGPQSGLHLLEAPYHIGRALVESPAARRETLKGLRDLPYGLLQGTASLVAHPGDTLSGLSSDISHRYGPLLRGDTKKFRKQLSSKHSGGAVPFALDAMTVGPGASATVGRLARAGAFGKTSRLGRLMREPRPALRYGHGAHEVRPQELSGRIVKAAIQKKRDRSRAAVHQRQVARAKKGERYMPPRARAGEVVARNGLAVRGRVVGPLPGALHTSHRLQAKAAAGAKSQARQRMLAEQRQVLKVMHAALGRRRRGVQRNLSSAEQHAFRYIYGGLVSAKSIDQAVRHIDELIAFKKQGRELRAEAGHPVRIARMRVKTNDEVALLEKLRGDVAAGKVDLAHLGDRARLVRKIESDVASSNPRLATTAAEGRVSQAQLRRYMPQAELLEHKGLLPARVDGEKWGSYIERVGLRRVVQAAQKHGLERPGYFPSERNFRQRFADRAVGGARPTPEHQNYTGALFRTGREDVRPEVLTAALLRGVKERHNVHLMADTAHVHGIDVPRSPEGAGKLAKKTAAAGRKQGRIEDHNALLAEARRQGGRVMHPDEEAARIRGLRVEQHHAHIDAQRARLAEVRAELPNHPGKDNPARQALVKERRRLQNRIRRTKRKIEALHEQGVIKPTARRRDLAATQALPAGPEAPVGTIDHQEFAATHRAAADHALERGQADVAATHIGEAQRHERFAQQATTAAAPTRDLGPAESLAARQAAADRIVQAHEPPGGRTPGELKDDLEHAGIDPNTVRLFNPGRTFRDLGSSGISERPGRHLEADVQGNADIHGALKANTLQVHGDGRVSKLSDNIRSDPSAFNKSRGWIAVPKQIMDELSSGYVPERLSARLWDIGKGKFSRTLLGAGNVSWLGFQVLSNAWLSGIVARSGPTSWIRAQMWWARLTPEERAAMEPLLGSPPHFSDYEQKRLGLHGANNRLVAAYDAFKQTAWMRAAHHGNPIDLMFRVDQAQNRFFRRAVLYNEAKRTAFKQMQLHTGELAAAQEHVVSALRPGRMDLHVNKVLSDYGAAQHHAELVDKVLGDYHAFTATERRTLGRFTMFYGFLRHSLRLTFWTLPVEHPIITSILGKLALMGAQQSRDLLGGDQLPWGLGKVYWKQGGQLMEIDLSRANPALNALTDIRSSGQLARVFPPFVAMLISQITQQNLQTGKKWQVRGVPGGFPTDRKKGQYPGPNHYTLKDHLKVLAAELSATVPPLRYGQKVTFRGPQGDDASVVFGPSGLNYRDPAIRRGVKQEIRRRGNQDTLSAILQAVLPVVPRASQDPEILRRRRRHGGSKQHGIIDLLKSPSKTVHGVNIDNLVKSLP